MLYGRAGAFTLEELLAQAAERGAAEEVEGVSYAAMAAHIAALDADGASVALPADGRLLGEVNLALRAVPLADSVQRIRDGEETTACISRWVSGGQGAPKCVYIVGAACQRAFPCTDQWIGRAWRLVSPLRERVDRAVSM